MGAQIYIEILCSIWTTQPYTVVWPMTEVQRILEDEDEAVYHYSNPSYPLLQLFTFPSSTPLPPHPICSPLPTLFRLPLSFPRPLLSPRSSTVKPPFFPLLHFLRWCLQVSFTIIEGNSPPIKMCNHTGRQHNMSSKECTFIFPLRIFLQYFQVWPSRNCILQTWIDTFAILYLSFFSSLFLSISHPDVCNTWL